MYQIKVNYPNLPEGAEVEVAGLGVFENGAPATELTDEQILAFQNYYATVGVTEEGTPGERVLGPTPFESFKDHLGVDVTEGDPVVPSIPSPAPQSPVEGGEQ